MVAIYTWNPNKVAGQAAALQAGGTLPVGKSYKYRVQAQMGSAGAYQWGRPSDATVAVVTNAGQRTVRVTWNALPDPVNQYVIFRLNETDYSEYGYAIKSVNGATLQYDDDGTVADSNPWYYHSVGAAIDESQPDTGGTLIIDSVGAETVYPATIYAEDLANGWGLIEPASAHPGTGVTEGVWFLTCEVRVKGSVVLYARTCTILHYGRIQFEEDSTWQLGRLHLDQPRDGSLWLICPPWTGMFAIYGNARMNFFASTIFGEGYGYVLARTAVVQSTKGVRWRGSTLSNCSYISYYCVGTLAVDEYHLFEDSQNTDGGYCLMPLYASSATLITDHLFNTGSYTVIVEYDWTMVLTTIRGNHPAGADIMMYGYYGACGACGQVTTVDCEWWDASTSDWVKYPSILWHEGAGGTKTNDGWVKVNFTANMHFRDRAGTDLQDVNVVCEDKDGNVLFNVNSAADGTIAEQQVTARTITKPVPWDGTNSFLGAEENHYPFKITISKSGYRTIIIDDFTPDGPMDWEFEMATSALSGGGPPGAVVEASSGPAIVTCPSSSAVVEVADT